MRLSRRKLSQLALVIVSIGLVGFGAYSYWQYHTATHNPHPAISREPVVHSIDKPDETPLKDVCDSHKVPANEPHKLTIPAIGVANCIEKVGIDQHNAIAVPTNISLAGWYIKSALPGTDGVSIIDGHVSGRYRDAVFVRLKDLKPGDTLSIERGDGSILNYAVKDVHEYSATESIDRLLEPLNGVMQQLNLITCGGNYDSASKTFDERVIVRAERT